jgi:hypothetical protein
MQFALRYKFLRHGDIVGLQQGRRLFAITLHKLEIDHCGSATYKEHRIGYLRLSLIVNQADLLLACDWLD